MLAKKNRLPRAVFDTPPSARARFAYGTVAFFRHSPAAGAVVVSKKVAKSAVTRNRIKRRTYHALRPHLAALTQSVVVYPRKDAADVPYQTFATALAEALASR